MEETTLNLLAPGKPGIITGLRHLPDMNRRLRDIGFIEGTRVECLYRSPWGSPIAYLVRGAVIAVRTSDSDRIDIRYV